MTCNALQTTVSWLSSHCVWWGSGCWGMQVSVQGSPAAWWQHAGHAALQECRLISRRQAPLSGIAQRRANRQLYQVLAIPLSDAP